MLFLWTLPILQQFIKKSSKNDDFVWKIVKMTLFDKTLDHDPARSVKMAQKVVKNGEKSVKNKTHDVHFLHCDVRHFRFWATKPIRWFQMVWRKTRFLAVLGRFLTIFGVFGHIFTLCFYNFWFFYTVFIIKMPFLWCFGVVFWWFWPPTVLFFIIKWP